MNSTDGFHLTTDDQLSTAADRWVSAVQAAFYPASAGGTTRSVTVTLTSDGTTPRANLTGLKWAFFND